jgi:iron-sulfur cluster assembly accessory protein
VNVALAPETQDYLENLRIDFVDDGLNRGFTFSNSRARHTCGCGSSFSV